MTGQRPAVFLGLLLLAMSLSQGHVSFPPNLNPAHDNSAWKATSPRPIGFAALLESLSQTLQRLNITLLLPFALVAPGLPSPRKLRKIWIAMSTPFQVNFFYPIIKKLQGRFEILITARNHDRIFSMMKARRLNFIPVGKHGGPTLQGKLESYAETIRELSPIIERERPDLLLTERWPEAVRVAFAFDIPAWTIFYDERERHVNKMVFPLSSLVFCPRFYTIAELREHGVDPSKIVWFNGFHTCYLKSETFHDGSPFSERGIRPPVVLVRPEPEFATYFDQRKNILEDVVQNLSASGTEASVVVLPRTDAQAERYRRFDSTVLTESVADNPVAHADIVIGAAETMLMESFVLGIPTVSSLYWTESKPVAELHKYVPHIVDPQHAVRRVQKFLDPDERLEFSQRSRIIVDQMDDPTQKILDEISTRFLLKDQNPYRHSGRRSKLEIYLDIVRAVNSRPMRLAHLMQLVNLSHSDAKSSISLLLVKGVLEGKTDGSGASVFEATPQGLELLKTYNNLRQKLFE